MGYCHVSNFRGVSELLGGTGPMGFDGGSICWVKIQFCCSATINACVTELVGILLRASELSWQNKVLGLCQPHDVDLQFCSVSFESCG